ncbi:alcohol dehydrogenase, zinc-containing [Lentisphaera araneosa HTCC2155]|uniref:Zinc-type alcohol dehydrogenase-like protein n=1 Tax=Lentisphaera araneosa HTCC2155 TaxID=313628 RepID=A6DNE0_9BACT|nr:zinc-binding alcohol dehydrogenase family protein [Lentisphaera araneosa]EDM26888.1 alcohol dehydrogenase, zinc-containing [Lentisphaera araneosa HTCC2155]
MKAVGYKSAGAIDRADALEDITLEVPQASGYDLLVEVKAISVNPVDYKIRQNRNPEEGHYAVIGWDASGIVKAVGDKVKLFKPGDRVWYAGDLTRQGSNAEFQLVDERIVGKMPNSQGFETAAALPLTTLTAWEMLFDRLQVEKDNANKSILVIGAAGGVGSIMVQLIKQVTKLQLIATASRPDTVSWLEDLGVEKIINHCNKLSDEFESHDLTEVDYVVSLNRTDLHFPEIVKVIKPQGKFGLIDDPAELDIKELKAKSISLHWEFMYTRSMFQTDDMLEQHKILTQVAEMIDQGKLKTTLGEHFGTINAENLRRAHKLLESGKSKGKIVLEGF